MSYIKIEVCLSEDGQEEIKKEYMVSLAPGMYDPPFLHDRRIVGKISGPRRISYIMGYFLQKSLGIWGPSGSLCDNPFCRHGDELEYEFIRGTQHAEDDREEVMIRNRESSARNARSEALFNLTMIVAVLLVIIGFAQTMKSIFFY